MKWRALPSVGGRDRRSSFQLELAAQQLGSGGNLWSSPILPYSPLIAIRFTFR
jgi:hypothetical protein